MTITATDIMEHIDLETMRGAMFCIRHAKTDEEAEHVADLVIGVMERMRDCIIMQNEFLNFLNLK